MRDLAGIQFPGPLSRISTETQQMGFPMASEHRTGVLLRTLAATKSGGDFLELGTGTGLSTAWILDGMDAESSLISIDNDERCLAVARRNLESDSRLQLIQADGDDYIPELHGREFDYIFADAWPGKYRLLDETLSLLRSRGVYIIDDMLPQTSWPAGHEKNVEKLISILDNRGDLHITKLSWASGIIMAVKR